MTRRLIRIEDAVKVLSCAIAFLGFLSVVRYVELSYSSAFASLFIISLYCEYRKRYLLPRWALTSMAFGVLCLTALRMNADDFISLTVEALLMLLAIKLLGAKRFRDYMQIYLISLFLLIGSALLSTDIEFSLYLVGVIFLITATVVLLTYFSEDPAMVLPASTITRILSKTSLISIVVIPVTVVMFLILPRTSYPVLYFLNKGSAVTGFGDSVRLGKVSDIQEDPAVAFRVHMEKVGDDLLYWRGIALDYFDGASWTAVKSESRKGGEMHLPGARITQIIYLEPGGHNHLFALDKPTAVSLRYAKKTAALTYTLPQNIFRRIRYDAVSSLSDILPEQKIERDVYLQMPEMDLARTRAVVKTLSSGRNGEETADAILHFLGNGEYRYSLTNLPFSDNPIEDFLFVHKYGDCEYFASAMAVMLRIAGVPSRIVGGYRGGYYNEAGGYYLVPQKNAHVWVEAYIENKGWLRMDPTPAGIENFVSGPPGDLLFRIRLLMDSMNYYWDAMVINYDFTKQLSLFLKMKSLMKRPRFRPFPDGKKALWYVSSFLAVVFFVLTMRRLSLRKRSPTERLLNAFFKTIGKHGYQKGRSEGLEEFVSRIRDNEIREKAYAFVIRFESFFYKDRKLGGAELRRLRDLLKW